MNKKLTFAIESAEIIEEPASSQFATARIRAFNTGKSLHDTWCDEEILRKTAPTIYEKPIVFELDKTLGDFGSHNDGVTIPAGFVVPHSATFFEEEDGRISLNVLAKIWKRYSGKFLEVFADTSTTKKAVSVEMEVKDFEELSNGLLRLLDFTYSAICVLGDYFTPASPNSEMEMISFAKEKSEEYQDALRREFASRYDEIDFTIPREVKRAAQKALASKGTGKYSTLALANARYLTANATMSPERIRTMAKRFASKREMDDVTLGLWGGKRAMSWCNEIVALMDEADGEDIKYFSEDWGTGDALKIDKGKEALSTTSWGSVDKTTLRNNVLKASNYKSLVEDVYMLVESGWEDHPSSSLKYPVMEIKDGTLVYNRYGLSAALQRAEGQDESSVVSKVRGIYRKLELEESKNMAKDDNVVTGENLEEETVAPDAQENSPAENQVETFAEDTSVQDEVEQTEQEPEAEEEENETEEFSYASVFSQDEMMAVFAEEEGDSDEIKAAFGAAREEFASGKDAKVMMTAMYAAFKRMQAKAAAYMAENKELKEFKAAAETAQKEFSVNETMSEISIKAELPEDVRAEILAEAENYSLENISQWQNFAKARSFDFAKMEDETEEEGVTAIGFSFYKDVKPVKDIWAD